MNERACFSRLTSGFPIKFLDKGRLGYILPRLPLTGSARLSRPDSKVYPQMIIDLKAITQFPCRLEVAYGPEWWGKPDENDPVPALDAPLTVRVELDKIQGGYVVRGNLSGVIAACCDRCLETFTRPLDADFRLFFRPPPAAGFGDEVVLGKEDLLDDFMPEEEVDLDAIVREQIYLSLPMKSLCGVDCRGLCQKCGANLNRGDCRCGQPEGHPGFSKLKNLKFASPKESG